MFYVMIETVTNYPHLTFSGDDGFPVVERVDFKAVHLIANQMAHGWTPEELVTNFPQLTLGEVYSVLAWYSDHRAAVSRILETRSADARAMAQEERHRQIANRLKEQGHFNGEHGAV